MADPGYVVAPGAFDAASAMCFKLTGERGYLEVGRVLLVRLAESQDWSDDPRKRGAVGMSPMYLSLLFFGVPCLLGVLQEAGLEE